MNENITELKSAEVYQDEIERLDILVQTLGSGPLHDTILFMLEAIKANKNLYMITTY